MSDLCGLWQMISREPAWDSGLGEKASRLPSLVCFFPTKLNAFKEQTLLFRGGYIYVYAYMLCS